MQAPTEAARGEDLARAIGEHLARARHLLAQVESASAPADGGSLATHGKALVAALEAADQAEQARDREQWTTVHGHLLAARRAAQAALARAAWGGVVRSSPVLARIGAIYGHLGLRLEESVRVASARTRAAVPHASGAPRGERDDPSPAARP